MTYRLIQTIKPAIEPVSLTEAKLHLRIDTTADDSLITSLIESSREICEDFTHRSFIKQRFSMFLDKFPRNGIVILPKKPFLSLIAINIYDALDVADIQDLDSYSIDTIDGRIILKEGTVFPMPTRKVNGIEISFDAGYGDLADDVPAILKRSILMVLTDLYEYRGDSADTNARLMRSGAYGLLQPYRTMGVK